MMHNSTSLVFLWLVIHNWPTSSASLTPVTVMALATLFLLLRLARERSSPPTTKGSLLGGAICAGTVLCRSSTGLFSWLQGWLGLRGEDMTLLKQTESVEILNRILMSLAQLTKTVTHISLYSIIQLSQGCQGTDVNRHHLEAFWYSRTISSNDDRVGLWPEKDWTVQCDWLLA